MKYQQVKTEWGISGEGGRGRSRATDKQSERWSIGEKWKWRGLETAVSEKGHSSIFSKNTSIESIGYKSKGTNLGWISNSSISLVPQHLFK
jgi:hypothetical protein